MNIKFISYFAMIVFSFFLFFLIQGYGSLKKLSFLDEYSGFLVSDESSDLQIDFRFLNSSEVMLSGKRFFYDEKFKLAIKSFNFLIDEYPDLIDSSVHSFLAESYYESQGKFSLDVTSHVEKALYLNPSDTRALSLEGLYYFQQNNFKQALKSWSIALENSTNNKEKESLIIAMNLALKKSKN
tara:strand:+ start:429 stop:977 length:549 start_codon:yes stop_codon:yes gene_type:complete